MDFAYYCLIIEARQRSREVSKPFVTTNWRLPLLEWTYGYGAVVSRGSIKPVLMRCFSVRKHEMPASSLESLYKDLPAFLTLNNYNEGRRGHTFLQTAMKQLLC